MVEIKVAFLFYSNNQFASDILQSENAYELNSAESFFSLRCGVAIRHPGQVP